MKVLTIKQPFASLIANNQKFIETRSWKTGYRGEMYIHAGLKKINLKDDKIKKLLSFISNTNIEYGMIICKVNLVDCVYMDEKFINKIKQNSREYLCGEYKIGRYGWIFENVEILKEPIACKGKLSIWNY